MLTILPTNYCNNSYNPSFRAHLPKNFEGMMNKIYTEMPDIFENRDALKVSTILENGLDVSGTAYFSQGRYCGLTMDNGFESYKQLFMKTALNKYKEKISGKKLNEKLQRKH